MKSIVLLSLLAMMLFTAFRSNDEPSPLLGRWEFRSVEQGSPFSFLLIFRSNGKYDGFMNKKTFVSGTYHMQHDTLYISDPICNSAYQGTYKIEYHGKADSLTFHLIRDSCRARREGSDGFTYKKVKTATKQPQKR
jgi:hypothetical protein